MNTLRTPFALDIPSDASPAFQTCVGTVPGSNNLNGGLEWKVRLCLLVAVVGPDSDEGTEGVRFKGLLRDGPRGEWGSEWISPGIACPLEKARSTPLGTSKSRTRPTSLFLGSNASVDSAGQLTAPLSSGNRSNSAASWASFFASYLSPSAELDYGDDDEEDGDSDGGVHPQGGGLYAGSQSTFSSTDDIQGGYDGIKPDLAGGVGRGVDFANGEEGWSPVRLEMVECEVPVRVWPGNTAFKAMDVVFEV